MGRYRELLRKLPPLQSDIEKTYELFKDFGIRIINIPEFATYAELERWRTNYIKTHIK